MAALLGGLASAGRVFAAQAADARHVLAIGAHPFAALTSGGPCFIRGEFMGGSLLVGRPSAFAGDLSLSFSIH
jgi:hypothetical protein